jgi:hypothetical protein
VAVVCKSQYLVPLVNLSNRAAGIQPNSERLRKRTSLALSTYLSRFRCGSRND